MKKTLNFQEFQQLTIADKHIAFRKNNRLFDVVYAEQFDVPLLEHLFALSTKIRDLAKTREGTNKLGTLLSDKRAMLFFAQPSTRTFLSFLNACHILGLKTSEIRDTNTSSEIKGESQEDTIQTFSSYVDLVIIRHAQEGFAELAAWTLNNRGKRSIPVINGGSGKDEHPTQALLDLYTIHRHFAQKGGIQNKHIAFIGDLARGRTARSLTKLLSLYPGTEFSFVAPKAFAMRNDILNLLKQKNITYHMHEHIEDVVESADAFYLTRIQDEHDTENESKHVDYQDYHFQESYLERIKKDAMIMHPFPRRQEIPTTIDTDPRAAYWRQARNGMWIRAALILYLLERDKEIYTHSK